MRLLKAEGFEGGRTLVNDYIRPKRPLRQSRVGTVRFETPPGHQLQHDWGKIELCIGGQKQRVYLAVNSLGYSRAVHVVAMPSMDAEHTYEALLQGFEYLGGSTATVLVDNQKVAVIDWREGKANFHPRFRELGKHCGFAPKACRPRRAQTKGKVERMVGYVKSNALAGNPPFESLAHLNAYLVQWCDDVANQRHHRELGEQVLVRWQRERKELRALPVQRFDTDYHLVRRVALDAYVHYRGRRYSVPGYLVGQSVEMRISMAGELRILCDQKPIVTHRVREDDPLTVTVAEHHQPLWAEVRVEQRPLQRYEQVA